MEVLDLNILKSESKSSYRELEKDVLDIYEVKFDNTYNVGILLNYIIEKNIYQVYCYIYTKDQVVSGLKSKNFNNKISSKLYFNYLKLFINVKGLKFFFENELQK